MERKRERKNEEIKDRKIDKEKELGDKNQRETGREIRTGAWGGI